MQTERRFRRSEQPALALTYQLQASAERAGVNAMLLSDGDGLLVAGSPWGATEAEEMAAILPLLARGGHFAGILLGERSVGRAVHVRSFTAEETDLFICAVGKTGDGVELEVQTAIEGVRRILD